MTSTSVCLSTSRARAAGFTMCRVHKMYLLAGYRAQFALLQHVQAHTTNRRRGQAAGHRKKRQDIDNSERCIAFTCLSLVLCRRVWSCKFIKTVDDPLLCLGCIGLSVLAYVSVSRSTYHTPEGRPTQSDPLVRTTCLSICIYDTCNRVAFESELLPDSRPNPLLPFQTTLLRLRRRQTPRLLLSRPDPTHVGTKGTGRWPLPEGSGTTTSSGLPGFIM